MEYVLDEGKEDLVEVEGMVVGVVGGVGDVLVEEAEGVLQGLGRE